MRLHKQTKLKAVLTALAGGLMLAFFGLVRAEPGLDAEAEAESEAPVTPTPDYGRFFAPSRDATPQAPGSSPPVHTRSRAS